MPVVPTQEILGRAFRARYGVAAINVVDALSMRAVLDAAVQERAPVILQTSVKTVQSLGVAHLFAAWTTLTGLAVAGAGLGLLVVPLVNVVLAAVPADLAGGASGTFSTAQQLGGAIGIALVGALFFDHVTDAHLNHAFRAALVAVAVAYVAAGLIALRLPTTAVSDERVVELG